MQTGEPSPVGDERNDSGTNLDLSVKMTQKAVITARFSNAARLSTGTCLGAPADNGFGATVEGELGARYDLDASKDLVTWTFFTSLTNSFGKVQFLDPAPPVNSPLRFYRARSVK